MRVTLAPAHVKTRPAGEAGARRLLAAEGPHVVLGGEMGPSGLAAPIRPAPATLFGPRGGCLAGPQGPLFVCDTGHHRLLVWNEVPEEDHAPADLVIGQKDFAHEGRNAKGEAGPATLNVPTGIAAAEGVLAVADAWNHRVLIWHGYPETSNRPADVVLGQADFASTGSNRGSDRAGRRYAVLVLRRRHRGWPSLGRRHRQPARARLGCDSDEEWGTGRPRARPEGI